eukprot:m.186290 g.186290  ORF g.186290 m.186290 type:complete len:639 (+) comp17508_c0_seq3:265-2181(+)
MYAAAPAALPPQAVATGMVHGQPVLAVYPAGGVAVAAAATASGGSVEQELDSLFERSPPADRISLLQRVAAHVTPLEAQLLHVLLARKSAVAVAQLAGVAAAANNEQWMLAMLHQLGPVQAAHIIGSAIPFVHDANTAAGSAVSRVLQSMEWHPDETGEFCQGCQATFRMASVHPAVGPEHAPALSALCNCLVAQTSVARTTAAAAAVSASAAVAAAAAVRPQKPLGVLVSGLLTAISKDPKRRDWVFVIDCTWSTGLMHKCVRTYDDLFTFQCKFLDMFPQEAAPPNRIIPFLPGRKVFSKKDRELALARAPGIGLYLQALFRLPPKLSQSEIFTGFFVSCSTCGGPLKPCMRNCSGTPLTQLLDSASDIAGQRVHDSARTSQTWQPSPLTMGGSSASVDSASVATAAAAVSSAQPDERPRSHSAQSHHRGMVATAMANSMVAGREGQSGHRESLISTSSEPRDEAGESTEDNVSRTLSTSDSLSSLRLDGQAKGRRCLLCHGEGHDPAACSQPTMSAAEMKMFLDEQNCPPPQDASETALLSSVRRYLWLKGLRLHKYGEHLVNLSRDQLISLTDDDLHKRGLAAGAVRKLRAKIAEHDTPWEPGYPFHKSSSMSTASSPTKPTVHTDGLTSETEI